MKNLLPDQTILKFLRPGMHSIIVGPRRYDYADRGVPFGGAADRAAFRAANILVGNTPGNACLEVALAGPSIEFIGGNRYIALTGADIRATLNGVPCQPYKSIEVSDGGILHLASAAKGFRTYLAVSGTWDIPEWLGGVTAFSKLLNPLSFIARDREIRITGSNTRRDIIEMESPEFQSHLQLSLLPGPEFDMLSDRQMVELRNQRLSISPGSSRTAIRFSSPCSFLEHDSSLISSGIVPGTVQLTHDGSLIILMADAQTTGGYPRIAVVRDHDLDRLAQLRPGDTVSFSLE